MWVRFLGPTWELTIIYNSMARDSAPTSVPYGHTHSQTHTHFIFKRHKRTTKPTNQTLQKFLPNYKMLKHGGNLLHLKWEIQKCKLGNRVIGSDFLSHSYTIKEDCPCPTHEDPISSQLSLWGPPLMCTQIKITWTPCLNAEPNSIALGWGLNENVSQAHLRFSKEYR